MHAIVHAARPQLQRLDLPVQVWGGAPQVGAASFFRLENGYLIRFHGIADFELGMDGEAVVCHPAVDAQVSWEPIFQQRVLPLQRAQQGLAVFHGGAVCRDGLAMVFLGPSGQGKSTLTAACASRGFAFLTDDCLVLSEGDCIMVEPDADHVRLWADSYQALRGSAPGIESLAWGKPRLHSDVDQLPHHPEPVPLACMLVLDVALDTQVKLVRLSPSEAALAWCANAFVVDQRSPLILRHNLKRGARLASALPAYRFSYPRDYAFLPDVLDSVSACLESVAAGKAL